MMQVDESRGNKRKILIGAGLLLFLALALWWWRGSSEDASVATDSTADASATGPRGQQANRDGDRGRGFVHGDLAGKDKAAISGTIRDPQGRPIADAQVCARGNDEALQGLGDLLPSCSRSEADGHYRIEGLWPVPTAVEASAASFIPARWLEREQDGTWRDEVRLRPGAGSEGVDIVLQPGGVPVRGVIKDISGGEIEGALVSVYRGWSRRGRSDGAAVATTDEDGRFEVWAAPGEVWVNARATGYALAGTEAGAPSDTVELFLTPESVLIGQVVHAQTGEPVPGVMVEANGGFSSTGNGEGSTRSDDQGNFRIDGLAPGSFKPIARGDEFHGEAEERVHLGLGQTSAPIVIRVHPTAYVEARVMIVGSGEPRPCPQGTVSLSRPRTDHERLTIEEGGLVHLRGAVPGEYKVEVSCEGYLSEEHYPPLVIAEDNLVDLVWEVREGLAIRGELVDDQGRPLDNIRVWAGAVTDEAAKRERATSTSSNSEPDGHFQLAGLLPGRYEVNAGNWSSRRGPEEPIIVELSGADVNDLRIEFPAVGTIRGRIVDERGQPVAGASATAIRVGKNGRSSARCNDAGEFEITDVPTGSTRVAASDGRWGAGMRAPGTSDDDLQGELVEVVGNEVVEVALVVESRSGIIRGRVVDEDGGPVADAFVSAERMSERAGANAARTRSMVRWGWGEQPVLTDPDGRFTLDELPEGKFIVHAHRKGGGEALAEEVALGSDIELVITQTGSLGGTVALAGGGPAPERFSVRVHDKQQGVREGDQFFRTDGRWTLRELPPGHYEITVSADVGTATTEVDLAADEVRDDLELELESLVTVRGRVVDLDSGEPIAGITVTAGGMAFMAGSNDDPERKHITGSDGRFELSEVPSGKVWFNLSQRNAGQDGKYGWNRSFMRLPPSPEVQDIGDLPIVATRLEPKQDAGDVGFTTKDNDPTTEPEDVTQEVAFIRPGGPAAGTELAIGDVIDRIDGHDVNGTNASRWWSLLRVPPGTKLRLETRDGKTIELVVGPALD